MDTHIDVFLGDTEVTEDDLQDTLENLRLLAEDKNSSLHVSNTCERALFAIVALSEKCRTLSQVMGELCDACGWAMKFPGEPCRCELLDLAERHNGGAQG